MTFYSGHCTFDAEVNHPEWGYIGRGNVQSLTQTSTYIRSEQQTCCNGYSFERGRLRAYDLALFKAGHIPPGLLRRLLEETRTREVILYRFFHRDRRNLVEHGWILTRTDHAALMSVVTGPTWKSRQVITAALQVVAAPSDDRESACA